MRLIPSPTPFPLYRTNQIPSTTAASSLRKRYDVAPATLNNFPKDLLPSKEHRFASSLKNLHSKYPSYLPQTSYVMHVDDDDDEESEEDFLGFMNPFSCDTEESSGEEDLGHNLWVFFWVTAILKNQTTPATVAWVLKFIFNRNPLNIASTPLHKLIKTFFPKEIFLQQTSISWRNLETSLKVKFTTHSITRLSKNFPLPKL